ncbi:hypothetical protein BH20ACI4_BH20ACI4_30580 [soil metagenome]
MLLGFSIGIAVGSALSALFIKLFARLIVKKSTGFVAAFIISFISFLAAIFIQDLTARKPETVWAVIPGVIFFLFCWLLNAQFLKYGAENENIGYGKTFFVTFLQCIALFFALLILSTAFISGLMFLGSQSK